MKLVKLFSMAMICMAIVLVSCSGEDGEQGPEGPAGAQGPAGADGADGIDGQNGTHGEDGMDGMDGNANVQAFDIDMSDWGGESTFAFDLAISALERPNYAFLFYLELTIDNVSYTHAVPGKVPSNPVVTDVLYSNSDTSPNAFISFTNLNGLPFVVPEGFYDRLIIIAAEITSVNGKASDIESLKDELKAAGVDTNDYNAVAAYFGLD
ncbi:MULTISPECIES: collagen-like protein [Flagellimonas]|uniref:Collagen-like protein n=1 Tax=Flagellimonas hadalis TaxID=2597517 RepID=A0A5N5IW73_9FLAO|nr:collagen-like protein [Allomuricauda hadalis]KAB5491019.1 collagen-like protein [Allomuricauda hadalis]